MGEGRRKRRRRVEPTDDWKQLKLLFGWPEQVRYEELRPLVLFGSSVAERAIEIEAAERTLYRRMDRFEIEGMESLFDSETARHRKLPPTIRPATTGRWTAPGYPRSPAPHFTSSKRSVGILCPSQMRWYLDRLSASKPTR
jgi:hypothetical protein